MIIKPQKSPLILVDGVFDPLHDGHLEYFLQAKKFGHFLTVNIASDKEIWLKRPSMGPLLNQEVRKIVIEGLKPVDEVIMMDTYDALISVKPDIYIKGADWNGLLPENELIVCKDLGIKVEYLDTVCNSSSKILHDFIKNLRLKHK